MEESFLKKNLQSKPLVQHEDFIPEQAALIQNDSKIEIDSGEKQKQADFVDFDELSEEQGEDEPHCQPGYF